MKNFSSYEEIEELGEGLIRDFFKQYKPPPQCVDIAGFVTRYLNAPLVYEKFAEDEKDRLGFTSDGLRSLAIYQNGNRQLVLYPVGTVVIDSYLLSHNEAGRCRFTIAHEAAHNIMDRAAGFSGGAHFKSDFDTERFYTIDELRERMSPCEWQANAMAAVLLMPRFLVYDALRKYAKRNTIPIYGDNVIAQSSKVIIGKMADSLGVSFSALSIRLRRCGIFEQHALTEYIEKELKLRGNDH